MRPPRTVDELLSFLGRRQTQPLPPVPAPVLLIQPGVTTRSIPGFRTIPTPSPNNGAPVQQTSSASTSTSARASTRTTASRSATSSTTADTTSSTTARVSSSSIPAVTSASSASRAQPRPSASEIENLLPVSSGSPAGPEAPSGTMASDTMQPTDAAEAPPDRGSANADSPDARGAQIGIVVGVLVAVGLLAGLLAMFCVRKANKKKARQAADRPPTPDLISRPLARTDSNPWQGAVRSGANPAAAAPSGGNWPMGAAGGNRNSIEAARFDEKQFIPYRSPPAPGGGGDQSGQFPAPPAPTAGNPDRESLSQYEVIAKINQHYAAAERMSRAPGNFNAVAPPSPLYFKPVPGNPRPDSMTFGVAGAYGAPPQQGRY